MVGEGFLCLESDFRPPKHYHVWPDLSLACRICEHILQAHDRRTYRRFFGGLYLHLGKVEQDWNFPYGPKRHINSPTLQPGHDGPLALAGIC